MDEKTVTAFRRLWMIWTEHQEIGSDAREWQSLLEKTKEICEESQGAIDPEFIRKFACDVLESLDRINSSGR